MRLISYISIFFLSSISFSANASPAFARQFSTSCNMCHTKAPALNKNGLNYLRQGFRFNKEDASALDLLLTEDSDERKYPVALMTGVEYSSDKEETGVGAKLFLTGSITKNISFFGTTKEIADANNEDMKFFKEKSSRAFFQYNPDNSSNVIIAGIITPLSQHGNLQRASAGSGFPDAKPEGLPGKFKYKTPIQNSGIERIRGLQYSYLSDSQIFASLAYGTLSAEGNNDSNAVTGGGTGTGGGGGIHGGTGATSDQTSEQSLIASLRYEFSSGYQLGLVYNQQETDNAYSLMLPLEKAFDAFSLNSTLVYQTSDSTNEYQGWENSLIFSLGEMAYIKTIANVAISEADDNEQAYHLSYNKMFNKYLMGAIAGIHIETENQDTDSVLISLHLVL